MTLGAIENDSLIYQVGKRIGFHAKRLGVQINFAPVVDINTNPANPIIGFRSFGEDKYNVSNKIKDNLEKINKNLIRLKNDKEFFEKRFSKTVTNELLVIEHRLLVIFFS